MNEKQRCVVVVNPASGSERHRERVRSLASEYGYTVRETRADGDAIEIARRAAERGVTRIGACGGDGTVNEVVRGIDAACALDTVTLGVIPAGTGNNFAKNIGVEGIEHGFSLLDAGETRRIDLGAGNGRLFVNSCVGGITASASEQTTSEGKRRFGVLAYVLATLETAREFDGVPLRVRARTHHEREKAWAGEAAFVLIGNARRFPVRGRTQANVEDGQFDVTIIEQLPPSSALGEATVQRIFGSDTAHTTHLRSTYVKVTVEGEESMTFSFDGEMGTYRELACRVRTQSLAVRVGESYEPDPAYVDG